MLTHKILSETEILLIFHTHNRRKAKIDLIFNQRNVYLAYSRGKKYTAYTSYNFSQGKKKLTNQLLCINHTITTYKNFVTKSWLNKN